MQILANQIDSTAWVLLVVEEHRTSKSSKMIDNDGLLILEYNIYKFLSFGSGDSQY